MAKNLDDTDSRIERVAEAAASAAIKRTHTADGVQAVGSEFRIRAMEAVMKEHTHKIEQVEVRLNEGSIEFNGIRKDIQHLTTRFSELAEAIKSGTRWFICLLITGVLAVAGSAIIWVIQNMNKQ